MKTSALAMADARSRRDNKPRYFTLGSAKNLRLVPASLGINRARDFHPPWNMIETSDGVHKHFRALPLVKIPANRSRSSSVASLALGHMGQKSVIDTQINHVNWNTVAP